MRISRMNKAAIYIGVIAILTGCGDGGIEEVKQWMSEVRRNTKVDVPKLSEPKKFTPFVYAVKDSLDPYNPGKLAIAMAKQQKESGANANTLKPDPDRRREILENYPLDNLRMVGTLQKVGMDYGLVLADKVVYQVKVGSYLGQNFGMVTRITENEIELKEIVQDAAGEWVERKAKLELQETKK